MRHTHDIHKAGLRSRKDDLVGATAQINDSGDDDRYQGLEIVSQSMRDIAAEFNRGTRESSSLREHLQQPERKDQLASLDASIRANLRLHRVAWSALGW